MSIWIPPAAAAKQREAAQQFTQQLISQADAVGRIQHFNKELKKIDPYVEVVKADDNATHPALKRGYWHIVRRPPVGMPAIVVHEGPDGEFRDLDSGILQTLRDGDMWSSERQRDRERMARKAEKAKEREEERERETRIDEIMDRLKVKASPGVRIPRAL